MTARILVADDVPANARLLEALLVPKYYEVRSFQDPREVPAAAAAWLPDVILLDVMMPEMDGYTLCRLLKASELTSRIPVIMVTALREAPDRLQALAAGADEFLTKPIEPEVLLARLRSTIRLKHLHDEWQARDDATRGFSLGSDVSRDLPSTEPGRVLIVDDLSGRAGRLRAVLRQENIDAAVAPHEAEALEATQNASFDLIIISLSLVKDDPLRLIARLRASNATRDTPLLLVSEPDQRNLLISGLDLGASDCIMQPLNDSELLLRAGNQIRRKQYQDRLRIDVSSALQLAAIDPLTELFNRRYLMNLLDRLCAVKHDQDFAVLMIDVDHFKSINDRHGHAMGDRVLKNVANILQNSVRDVDVVSRYGGEEFVVVIRSLSDPADATRIAEKLRLAVEQMPRALNFGVTVSIGVAAADGPCPAAMLIARADRALYEAKRFGRNQVAVSAAADATGARMEDEAQ